jgi:predicted RNase H-like HicB family nuclease
MSKSLEKKAQELAAEPYTINVTKDETTDGEPIYVLYNPELPGCLAQGWTIEEAQENLLDAREGYILSLLQDNLPVPLPQRYATQTSAGGDHSVTIPLTIGLNQSTRPTVQAHWETIQSPETPKQFLYPSEEQPSDNSESSMVMIQL